VALCGMFHRAIRGQCLPKHLSSGHDPLYRLHLFKANLRVLAVTEIKPAPYVPLSHPFVERLMGTLRREYLDRTLFWTAIDLDAIERMSGWKKACQIRVLTGRHHQSISNPTGGADIVEGCIRLHSPHSRQASFYRWMYPFEAASRRGPAWRLRTRMGADRRRMPAFVATAHGRVGCFCA
jgi:hypothetical protein